MIRAATSADAAAIVTIWNPVIRTPEVTFNATEKTEGDICAMIGERARLGHCFVVAETAGGVQGFASYAQFRGGVGYAHTMEHSVILRPEARGQGLGRALMRHVEDHAKAAGAHMMIAGVSSANPNARAFHVALGYDEVAVVREVGRKFGVWYDLHLMQKRL